MLLVILQHSYVNVNISLIAPLFGTFIFTITSLAAVAFLSISGAILSYHLLKQPDWEKAYRRYVAQTLLLFCVGHLAINLINYPFCVIHSSRFTDPLPLLTRLFLDFPITDAIAACILISPLFIVYLTAIWRALFIVALLVVSRFIVVFVDPVSPFLVMVREEAIFGAISELRIFWSLLVPWFAVVLSGSFIGVALSPIKKKYSYRVCVHKKDEDSCNGAGRLLFCTYAWI